MPEGGFQQFQANMSRRYKDSLGGIMSMNARRAKPELWIWLPQRLVRHHKKFERLQQIPY